MHISVACTAASALYGTTNQPLKCVQNKPWRNNCCHGCITAAQSKDLDYFALGRCRPSILSLFLMFITENGPPKVCLTASILQNVLLQAIVLECGALRLIRRAFSNDACYIYYALNTEPVWQSRRRPPQLKFVVWVCKFPGKFVYRNDVTRGCGYIHKWSNTQTIAVENLKSKS